MKALKSARIVAASLGVLAFGALAASPAMAFDNVDWTWNKTLTSTETQTVYINLDIDTTGMVEVEGLQIYLGTLEAYSDVFCVTYYDCWDVSSVVSNATAIANLESITSDVPVYLHDGQFLADTDGYVDFRCNPGTILGLIGIGAAFDAYGDANLHTALALAFTASAMTGLLDKAQITAQSHVGGIYGATVDSTATAIGNLKQVTLESNVNGIYPYAAGCSNCGGLVDALSNHVVIADITQFAYADIDAVSSVHGVNVDNTIDAGTAIVNSAATAIGNAVIINVGNVTQ